MKRLFKFKYPKIAILFTLIIFAYWLFTNQNVSYFFNSLGKISYLGYFISGVFFALGFTAPFSAGFFITSHPSNIFLSALVGGLGVAFSIVLLFNIIRFSFKDEIIKLKNSKFIKKAEAKTRKEESHLFPKKYIKKLNHYLIYVFAGFLIASPLPDEFGLIMLASISHIKSIPLAIITFILSTIGIFILLLI
ncbi:MAG TPA: hypothetical protein P5277_01925 [Candidatus Paceibacterota bacterium]|nr:hypothetical protein [Candidatus Paceibacterota bacterium]